MSDQMTSTTPLMRRLERERGKSALGFWTEWGPPGGYRVQDLADSTGIARRTWENWANRFGWPWDKGALNG